MKFLVLNQHKSDNLGDQLIHKMICENIEKSGNSFYSAGFSQVTDQQLKCDMEGDSVKNRGARLKNLCPLYLKYWLKYKKDLGSVQKQKELTECDVIMIGGGQLIKHKSVFVYCMYNWMRYARRNKKPIVIWGVGVDDHLNQLEIKVYRKVFQYASYINVRDQNSAQKVKKYFKMNCSVSPDIAFTYVPPKENGNRENKIIVMPYNYKTAVKLLGLKKTKEQYYEDIFNMLSEKTDNTDLILTATTSEDIYECVQFQKYLNDRNIVSMIKIVDKIEEMVRIFSESTCVITGRMHAMILALVCETGVMPIEVSDKISGFADEFLSEATEKEVLRTRAMCGFHKCIHFLEKRMQNK